MTTQAADTRIPTFRRGAIAAAGVALWASVSLTACSSTETPQQEPRDTTQRHVVRVPLPTVDRDLDTLRERGTLRVLLRNSSSSYYILRGEEHGFEFELAREVARTLGLRLQVVLPDSVNGPIDALNLGHVDLVAMPLRPDAVPDAEVAFSRPYDTGQQTIVTTAERASSLRGPRDLVGAMVATRRFSGGEATLFSLRRQGVPVGIVMHPPRTAVEELLDLVADGTYPAAVADDRSLAAVLRFRQNLVSAFELGERESLHWMVRANAPKLRDAVDAVLLRHYRPREDDTHAGSEFYNVVRDRYFSDDTQIHRHATDPFRLSRTGRVSPYDDLFRATADSFDVDWRLLAALAFQESRFDPDAESWAGAIGVMQVKPATARLDETTLRDASQNIAAGTRHLRWLLDRYHYVPESDRLQFALAAYNCGHGHLDDARMLAVRRGLNPNAWEGSVRESLLLLRKPQYHREARYGYVRGHETVAYVREVMRRHDLLRRLAVEAPEPAPMAANWGAGSTR